MATPDGLAGAEGTFCMCSFWYAECLARSGDLQKARFFFEKMLGYANHLGLYAEELGPRGEHLGNFPQAFTHLGADQRRLLSRPRAVRARLTYASAPQPGRAARPFPPMATMEVEPVRQGILWQHCGHRTERLWLLD